jgi:predicted nucleic acid-binding protein
VIIVDAGVVVELLVDRDGVADRLADRLADEDLVAPSLIDAEVMSGIRGLVLGGKVGEEPAARAMSLLAEMPVDRVPLPPLLATAWRWRRSVSAYDALYAAAAVHLDCGLLTTDGRLSRALAGSVPVELAVMN